MRLPSKTFMQNGTENRERNRKLSASVHACAIVLAAVLFTMSFAGITMGFEPDEVGILQSYSEAVMPPHSWYVSMLILLVAVLVTGLC